MIRAATALLLLLTAVACGEGSCEKLGKQCAACTNSKAKANCQAIADTKNGDACATTVDSKVYDAMSPSCVAP